MQGAWSLLLSSAREPCRRAPGSFRQTPGLLIGATSLTTDRLDAIDACRRSDQ